MASGPLQGKLLTLLCRLLQPRTVVEIGTYSGYSALARAAGMPEGSRIFTFEINDEQEDFTRPWLENSPWRAKVDIRMVIGDILQAEEQVPEGIDLAFVDGNKRDYLAYYEFLLPRLSPGGCMLADNTLWDGHVLEPERAHAAAQTPLSAPRHSAEGAHIPHDQHTDPTMETTRQHKIARLLQKELSEIFLLQTKAMHGVLVSVSKTYISPDMSICRAYLSIFPSERGEEIVSNINANAATLRFELGKRVRHQLRIIPELKFFIDDSLDYAENIDRLLKL